MRPAGEALAGALSRLVVRSDEEIEALERDERRSEASTVLERLPDYVRSPAPGQLLARLKNDALHRFARTWDPEHGSLLLLGTTDRGKSSAAGYIVRRLVARGVARGGPEWRLAQRIEWFAAKDIERARLEHPLGKDEAPEIVRAVFASVLVLDDAGWDRDPTVVSSVLADRYEAARPSIVTSGLDRTALVKHYGHAVVRRMCDAGGPRVQVVEVT